MTVARRLAKLEGSLGPAEVVYRLLAEVQQFSGLVEYTRSIVELPDSAAPLNRITEQVETAVRASMRGEPRDTVETAVRRAVGDAVFLFVLALKLNGAAFEVAKVEGLRAAALFFWMGALLGGPRADDLTPIEAKTYKRELADRWAQWRTVADRLSLDVRVENEARATLERRFFGGHDVFFEDVSRRWAEHVDMIERLASLADAMAPTGGPMARSRRSKGSDAVGSVTERVADRVARLADDARVRAYETLGDRPRAVQILERRLSAD